jgi:hypothetical protein
MRVCRETSLDFFKQMELNLSAKISPGSAAFTRPLGSASSTKASTAEGHHVTTVTNGQDATAAAPGEPTLAAVPPSSPVNTPSVPGV